MPTLKLFDKGVSYSMLRTFVECRESCRLQYLEGYRAPFAGPAAEFGSAFHECNANIVHQNLATSREAIPQDVAKVCTAYERTYLTNFVLDKPARANFRHMMRIVQVLLTAYLQYYWLDDRKNKYIAREDFFTFDYPVRITTDLTLLVPFYGIWDGIFKRSRATHLLETKTKARWDEADISDSLAYDNQTMLYGLAMKLASQGPKKFPTKVTYDLVRRPGLKQGVKETEQEFLTRVGEDVHKRPSHYFTRIEYAFLRSDFQKWEQLMFKGLLYDLCMWVLHFYPYWQEGDFTTQYPNPQDNPLHYANALALITPYGRSDMFAAVTQGNFKGLQYNERWKRVSFIPVPT